ncbi:asparagine synthase-related protein [Streptomyces luteoverticillatus]|uniref:asparagine synthase-related protein n=1 Tax=Streptomyces luteoverticillatus TaxID=66425 RepID=UPI0013DE8946|nr:asparagine synthase-related protein [Streptomyces luteoverticillatus]
MRYPSGRPWLLGEWPVGDVVVAEAGSSLLALIGRCPVNAEELALRLRGMRELGDTEQTEQVVAGLPGSFHVVVSAGGRLRVRGTASAVRRVFHAESDGVTVAASRADALAHAVGAVMDEEQLALHLLSSPPSYPFGEHRSLWRGVQAVRPGHALLIGPDGRATVRPWWEPPEPDLSLAEGAENVRRALSLAVSSCTANRTGNHTANRTVISADLSGGLDSTTLCFLAARGPARLITFHWASLDPGNDDTAWARKAAALLPDAEHVAPEPSDATLWFSGLGDVPTATDEPGLWARDSARLLLLARLMTRHGSRLHLTGGGGDELFGFLPPYLHAHVRSRSLSALRQVNRTRVMQRWPLRPLLAELSDRTTFADWLATTARRITDPALPARPRTGRVPSTAWEVMPQVPPWARAEAVDAARTLLREASSGTHEPLAAQRGQHAALSAARTCGRAFRVTEQVTAALGLPSAAPYLDDNVLEAALSVRITERGALDRCKPLLTTAVHPDVPGELLARSTKGEYTADFHQALHRNKAALNRLVDDSHLARAGLVDTAVLRAHLAKPGLPPEAMRALDNTVACEMWLRGCSAAKGRSAAKGAP